MKEPPHVRLARACDFARSDLVTITNITFSREDSVRIYILTVNLQFYILVLLWYYSSLKKKNNKKTISVKEINLKRFSTVYSIVEIST